MPIEPRDDVSRVLAAIDDLRSRIDPVTLRLFVEELLRWNPQLGLVSKRDTPAVVVRLIRQSGWMWEFVCESLGEGRVTRIERIVDIGSGGGIPGLVWKMLLPSREFLLVERKERKIAFLERVIARARLAGVTALGADLHEVARRESHRARYDLAVMAAVTDPADVAVSIERLLREPGYFCTVRGRDEEPSAERLGRRLELLARSDIPDGRFLLYAVASPH